MSSLTTLRWNKMHPQVCISRCQQQSAFKSVKQLVVTFSCGFMSWCCFTNLFNVSLEDAKGTRDLQKAKAA